VSFRSNQKRRKEEGAASFLTPLGCCETREKQEMKRTLCSLLQPEREGKRGYLFLSFFLQHKWVKPTTGPRLKIYIYIYIYIYRKKKGGEERDSTGV
jgi:hypothetical protein